MAKRNPVESKPDKKFFIWKEHPILIPIGAGAAVAVFFSSVVIPQITAYHSAQIEELKGKQSAMLKQEQESLAQIRDLKISFERQKAAAEQANARAEENYRLYREARLSNAFEVGSPYPKGLGRLKIGMTGQDVLKIFPNTQKIDGEPWVKVATSHPLFPTAVYYLSGLDVTSSISHIFFIGDKAVTASWLEEEFNSRYGQPQTRTTGSAWRVNPQTVILHSRSQADYTVFRTPSKR